MHIYICHKIFFSSYFEFVVTKCLLTVFESKWQCFLQTALGSSRESGSLIDSDVFFECVLKFLIHWADQSWSAWQDTLINMKKEDKNNNPEKKKRNESTLHNWKRIDLTKFFQRRWLKHFTMTITSAAMKRRPSVYVTFSFT